jgi:hypothetical protein
MSCSEQFNFPSVLYVSGNLLANSLQTAIFSDTLTSLTAWGANPVRLFSQSQRRPTLGIKQ